MKLRTAFALVSGFASLPAQAAVDFYLRAEPVNVTMPGTGEVIPMWGFARDTTIGANDGTVTVPGPVLTVPPTETTVRIYVTNNLPTLNGQPTPVSIVIPGQTALMTPVRHGNGRVRSLTHETAPGTTVLYQWTNFKAGTFLYQSGSHPAVQVQMGLYGAIKKSSASGFAYPSKPYDQELTLVYSEIDPALHQAVATDDYGPGKSMTSTVNYSPKYFLINGQPYSTGAPALSAGTVGQKVLLRLLNAGLKTHVPLLQNQELTLIAEDGNPYNYPKTMYSVLLPAGKTIDAILTPTAAGTYPLYDARFNLTNSNLPGGGMLTYLSVSPVRVRDQAATAKKRAGARK